VVSIILSEDGVLTIKPAPQSVDQTEEKRSVAPAETAVQKCRRKQKENKVALEVEDVVLGVEQSEKMDKMRELKGELKILSRLTGDRPGTDITQQVNDCINKVAEAERKSQEKREMAMKTMRGDKKKRKFLDDLLETEVSVKKKRIAELDENYEKASKMATLMEQSLMPRLRY